MQWCPNDYTQSELKTLKGWSQCNAGTPDHFDACAAGSASGVPKNIFGSQQPLDGEAYAGLVLYASSKPNYANTFTPRWSTPSRLVNGCAWNGGFARRTWGG